MVWKSFQLFSIVILCQYSQLVVINRKNLIQKQDQCNKKVFIQDYVENPNKTVGLNTVADIRGKCAKLSNKQNFKCIPAAIVVYYGQLQNKYFFIANIDKLNDTRRKDCWGYILKAEYGTNKTLKYFNFKDKVNTVWEEFNYFPNVTLNLELYTLPFSGTKIGGFANVKIKSPSLCSNHVLLKMNQKLANYENKCNRKLDLVQRFELAEKLCNNHPSSAQDRLKAINNKLVTNNCKLFNN